MTGLQDCLLGIIGVSAGMLIAAGLVALITTTGVITRMADKTHTADFVKGYENAVFFGGVLWNLFWIFPVSLPFPGTYGLLFLTLLSLCQGIFVGCLTVSLAEALNGFAIFGRRIKLSKGIGTVILFFALGKTVYALLQFWFGMIKG